jgi:hypothetical protein
MRFRLRKIESLIFSIFFYFHPFDLFPRDFPQTYTFSFIPSNKLFRLDVSSAAIPVVFQSLLLVCRRFSVCLPVSVCLLDFPDTCCYMDHLVYMDDYWGNLIRDSWE